MGEISESTSRVPMTKPHDIAYFWWGISRPSGRLEFRCRWRTGTKYEGPPTIVGGGGLNKKSCKVVNPYSRRNVSQTELNNREQLLSRTKRFNLPAFTNLPGPLRAMTIPTTIKTVATKPTATAMATFDFVSSDHSPDDSLPLSYSSTNSQTHWQAEP